MPMPPATEPDSYSVPSKIVTPRRGYATHCGPHGVISAHPRCVPPTTRLFRQEKPAGGEKSSTTLAQCMRSGGDGDLELAKHLKGADLHDVVNDQVQCALDRAGLQLNGFVKGVVVMLGPPDKVECSAPRSRAELPALVKLPVGLLAIYQSTPWSVQCSDLSSLHSVLAAGDIRVGSKLCSLSVVDGGLVNARPHTPRCPPPEMPQLLWHVEGGCSVQFIRARPQSFDPTCVEWCGHDDHLAYDVVYDNNLPSSGQHFLPNLSPDEKNSLLSALNSVLNLVKKYVGAPPTEPIAHSHTSNVWERELGILRKQIGKSKHVELVDEMLGTSSTHFFERLCWAWTGKAYAIFEVVSSGKQLVELRSLHASTPTPIDFGALCGLPIYTNTPEDEIEPVHLRLLGLVQGGNAYGTVFVTPLERSRLALRTALKVAAEKRNRSTLIRLRPVLPRVAPPKAVQRSWSRLLGDPSSAAGPSAEESASRPLPRWPTWVFPRQAEEKSSKSPSPASALSATFPPKHKFSR